MTKTYSVNVYDNIVSPELQAEVWEYILNREYYAKRKILKRLYPLGTKTVETGPVVMYTPADKNYEYMNDNLPGLDFQYMHRTKFGDSAEDLAQHTPIQNLWNTINSHLDNQYEINGVPEEIAHDNVLNLGIDGRVYVNIQMDETIKRTHGIHRDSIDVDDDSYFTMIYIANPVWYPTWGAENVFYADDDTTGDTQQFQKNLGQSRNFGVGWPYKYVEPRPGRVMLYDGRTLHTTKPATIFAGEHRYAVAFRLKKFNLSKK
jgi:hypothetical protein